MQVSDANRLKALEDESAKLKPPDADAMLNNEPVCASGPSTMAGALEDLLGQKW